MLSNVTGSWDHLIFALFRIPHVASFVCVRFICSKEIFQALNRSGCRLVPCSRNLFRFSATFASFLRRFTLARVFWRICRYTLLLIFAFDFFQTSFRAAGAYDFFELQVAQILNNIFFSTWKISINFFNRTFGKWVVIDRTVPATLA